MQTSIPDTHHAQAFSLSASAAERIAYLLNGEPEGTRFWIGVDGGGCSGFQYRFDLSAKPLSPTDHEIFHGAARVAIDDISLGFLKDSQLDYEEDLSHAGFVVKNPNATARCGCGNSFSVAF